MFTVIPGTGTTSFLQRILWSDVKMLLLDFKSKNVLIQVKFGGNNPPKRQRVANYLICVFKTMYGALSLGCFLKTWIPLRMQTAFTDDKVLLNSSRNLQEKSKMSTWHF